MKEQNDVFNKATSSSSHRTIKHLSAETEKIIHSGFHRLKETFTFLVHRASRLRENKPCRLEITQIVGVQPNGLTVWLTPVQSGSRPQLANRRTTIWSSLFIGRQVNITTAFDSILIATEVLVLRCKIWFDCLNDSFCGVNIQLATEKYGSKVQ